MTTPRKTKRGPGGRQRSRSKSRAATPARPDAPADRRGELVRAAYDLIAEKGLEGLRTRDIAAHVGINISTLHYHFDTKEALLAGVVEYVTQLFKSLHAPLPPGATPLDELRHLITGQSRRRRVESRVDVVMHELMLRSRRDPQVRRAFESLMQTWRAVVEAIVARCLREYMIRDDVDPRTASAVVTSFLIGANVQLGITPTTFAFDHAARGLVTWLVAPAAARAKTPR
jgi:AcrR family transcriptional regulator